jgi:hypothetical protein
MRRNTIVRSAAIAAIAALAIACGKQEARKTDDTGVVLVKSEGGQAAPAPVAPAAPEAAADGTRNIAANPNAPAPLAPQPVMVAPGVQPVAVAPGPNLPPLQVAQNEIALRYAVMLFGDPTFRTYGPENMTFACGQRFCVLMIPSCDMYLYMIAEGTDGRFNLLAPLPGMGTSIDRLTGGETQVFPLTGNYTFDMTPGTERIHVVAGPHKNERMEQLIEAGINANNTALIEQTLDGVRQREEVGFETRKKTGSKFSEIILTAPDTSRGFVVGTISLKHQ